MRRATTIVFFFMNRNLQKFIVGDAQCCGTLSYEPLFRGDEAINVGEGARKGVKHDSHS